MEKRLKAIVFEGQSLQLKETLFIRPDLGLSVFYTQGNDYNVWVFDISSTEGTFFLDNQRTALSALAEQAAAIDLFGEVSPDENTVCLVTERVEKDNLAVKVQETSIIDYDIISLGISASQILMQLHQEEKVANCIDPEYIFMDKDGCFKFVNFTLCFHYRHENVIARPLIVNKFFAKVKELQENRYRDSLNPSRDVKNLGILLYQLCFSDLDIKYKEEDSPKLSFPNKPKHSFSILCTIENCLDPLGYENKALLKLVDSFQNEKRLDLHENTGSNDSTIMANISLQNLEKTPNSDSLKPGFIASLSTMVSNLTTDTEGWFKSYVVENNAAPEEEFVNKILQKAWKNRDKVKKLYDIIDKFLDNQDVMKCSAIAIKVLIFLHSLMTKGPIEVLTAPLLLPNRKTQVNMSIVVESCSYLNYLLRRIKSEWEPIAKTGLKHKGDKLRSQALSYLIYFYAIVLTEKSKFGFDYEKIFAGNFSVDPLLKSQEVKLLFNYKTFVDLHSYGSMLLRFFKLLPEDVGVRAIQFAVAKATTFEIYNLLAVFCHFVSMYKKVALSFDRIDKPALEKMIEGMETALDNCIFRFHYCLEELKCSSAFKIFADLLPHSSLTAISEIKLLQAETQPIENFSIEEYFPSNTAIGNFVIPSCYGNDDSPSRIVTEEEKLQIIKRELIKANKVNASRTTQENMVISTPFQISSKTSSDKPALISGHRNRAEIVSEKIIREEDFSEEQAEAEMNPTINQSPEKPKLHLKRFPDKVPLISISKQGAAKNPYLNAHDDENEIGLSIAGMKLDEGVDENHGPKEITKEQYEIDCNDAEVQHSKEYKVFEDSYESDKKPSERASSESKDSPQKAYDAKNALSNEFLKLVPLPVAKEDKQIQCDMEKDDLIPDSKDSFNLEKFMKEEIANGRMS